MLPWEILDLVSNVSEDSRVQFGDSVSLRRAARLHDILIQKTTVNFQCFKASYHKEIILQLPYAYTV